MSEATTDSAVFRTADPQYLSRSNAWGQLRWVLSADPRRMIQCLADSKRHQGCDVPVQALGTAIGDDARCHPERDCLVSTARTDQRGDHVTLRSSPDVRPLCPQPRRAFDVPAFFESVPEHGEVTAETWRGSLSL
eukprot:Skav207300  [mRNA]  locus=scaffold3856:12182:12586:+ [translate_table: standard]